MLVILKNFFILITIKLIHGSTLEHDGWATIKLQHALTSDQPPIYTNRGNITIQSLRLGQAIIDQDPLTELESAQFRDLALKNRYYQIKANVISNEVTEKIFLSTVKACMLTEAKLDDRLSVSLDYSGRVVGVALVVASTSACEGADVSVDELKQFTTSVYVRHTETGPVPDTASYIEKLEREKEAKERGEVKDNRSFLAKYWMYIVPVLILMMVSSLTNPEATAAGGAAVN